MNNLYKNYLKQLNIISEDEFIKEFNNLPRVIKDNPNIEFDNSLDNDVSISEFLITKYIVESVPYAYIDEINVKSKNVCIYDVDSIEDLNKLKSLLEDWTITNYKEIEQRLIEEEEEELKKYNEYCNNRTKLKNIINELDDNSINNLTIILREYTINELKEFIEHANKR